MNQECQAREVSHNVSLLTINTARRAGLSQVLQINSLTDDLWLPMATDHARARIRPYHRSNIDEPGCHRRVGGAHRGRHGARYPPARIGSTAGWSLRRTRWQTRWNHKTHRRGEQQNSPEPRQTNQCGQYSVRLLRNTRHRLADMVTAKYAHPSPANC